MACNCGSKKAAPKSFTVTAQNGDRKTYSTEVEAAAAAKRLNGTYRGN